MEKWLGEQLLSEDKYIEITYDMIVWDEKTREWCCHIIQCPNYDKSWACPPASPYMEETLKAYSKFWLVVAKHDLRPAVERYKKEHPEWGERMLYNPRYYNGTIKKKLRNLIFSFFYKQPNLRYGDALVLWGGGCRVCKNAKHGGCTYPDNPCRFPGRRQYAMESVGINVHETAKKVGIELEWPPRAFVHQIGLICLKEEGK